MEYDSQDEDRIFYGEGEKTGGDSNVRDEDTKRVIKEALKEWLDEKFLMFGRYSAHALAAAGLVALIYFILKMNHWSIVDTSLVK